MCRTLLCCAFQYILLSSTADWLVLPSLKCLCGNHLMTWNNTPPDSALCFLFIFSLGSIAWGKCTVHFAEPSGVLCWFLCLLKSLPCAGALHLYGGWSAVKNIESGVRNPESLELYDSRLWILGSFNVSIREREENLFHASHIPQWSRIKGVEVC